MSADRPSGGQRPSGAKQGGSSRGGPPKRGGQYKGKPGGSSGGKPGGGKASSGRAGGGNASGGKPSGGKPGSSAGGKPSGGKPRSSSSSSSKPSRGASGTGRSQGSRAAPRDSRDRSPQAPVKVSDFDEELIALARAERVLPGDVKADLEVFHPRVADLLGAAYLLVEEAPDEALRYALEAKRHASRSPVVREACGMAAYYAGQFDVAIKELRTVRRLTGRDDMVPLIADCERALGHPQKAIDMASEPLRLAEDNQIELRIVAAGARMDLGQPEAAALLLRVPLLEAETSSLSSARLKYAYAEAMLAAGDVEQARAWFARAVAADADDDLDAQERLEALAAPQ